MYAQNTFNEVLGWYGLCASTTTTPSLTTASFNAGQTVVSSSSSTYLDDVDSRLIIAADSPLDLTCNTAVTASSLCSFLQLLFILLLLLVLRGGVLAMASDDRSRDREIRLTAAPLSPNDFGQVVNTHVPLSSRSIIWYTGKWR